LPHLAGRHRQTGGWPACEEGLSQVAGRNGGTYLPQLRRLPLLGWYHQPCRWLYLRFPLSLRMVDELLAARGIMGSPLSLAVEFQASGAE